jgi:hypothetical protein
VEEGGICEGRWRVSVILVKIDGKRYVIGHVEVEEDE